MLYREESKVLKIDVCVFCPYACLSVICSCVGEGNGML